MLYVSLNTLKIKIGVHWECFEVDKCFFKVYTKKIPVETHVKRLLGDRLVTSSGEKWFKMRKLGNQAFHGESLKVKSCFDV